MDRRLPVLWTITFLCLVGSASPLRAQESVGEERILNFDTVITVQSDASLSVVENIRVQASGAKMKYGIARDFLTRYKDKFGNNAAAGFELVQVLRDGQPEDYYSKAIRHGQRIYIGKKGVVLPKGVYVYTIAYSTNRQIAFFNDHDELYFNVTGNEWRFPIDEVSATVQLPGNADIISVDAYTGYAGDMGKEFTAQRDYLERPVIRTTRTLKPGEGMTINVFWPKGYVQEPGLEKQWEYLVQDHGYAVTGVIILLMFAGGHSLIRSKFLRSFWDWKK